MKKDQREGFAQFDWVKLVMALFVCAIHTQPWRGEGYLFQLYMLVLRLAVPFFFMVSGYLGEKKSLYSGQAVPPADYWTRRIRKTVKSYLIWSAVYLPMAVIGYLDEGRQIGSAAADYVFRLVAVGEHFYSWQLWFLLSMFYGVCLTAMFRKRFGLKILLIVSFVLYLSGHLINLVYENHTLSGPGWQIMLKLPIMPQIVDGPGRILTGPLYLILGMACAHLQPIRKSALVALFAGSFLIGGVYDMWALSLLSAVSLFLLICGIPLRETEASLKARRVSAWVYYVHMAFYFIWYLLRGHVTETGLYPFLFSIGLSGVFCICVHWVRSLIAHRGGDSA